MQLCYTSLSSCSFYITFTMCHLRLHQSLLHPVVLSQLDLVYILVPSYSVHKRFSHSGDVLLIYFMDHFETHIFSLLTWWLFYTYIYRYIVCVRVHVCVRVSTCVHVCGFKKEMERKRIHCCHFFALCRQLTSYIYIWKCKFTLRV